MTNNSWQKIKLENIVENLDNKRIPVAREKRKKGTIPYYGATGIVDYVEDYIFDEELLLVGEDGADWSPFANTSYIIRGKSWINNHAHVLRVVKANIGFLMEFLNYSDLTLHTSGTTRGKLNKSNLMNIQIPLPDRVTQDKIYLLLASLNDQITKTDEIIQKTGNLKRGLMENILSFEDKVNVEHLALGDIGKVSMCKRIFKKETLDIGDIPFYKIGTFGKEPDSFISQELYDSYRNKFPFPKTGDVLLSASGTIGRKVKYDGRPAYFQDSNIVWLEHDESKILNNFLFYLYDRIRWQTEGSTIKRLYNDILLKKIVPVPPINKQRQILEILMTIDQKISVTRKSKGRFILFKNGLMQDIFSQKIKIN